MPGEMMAAFPVFQVQAAAVAVAVAVNLNQQDSQSSDPGVFRSTH